MHPFENVLSVSVEEIEIELGGQSALPWADFLLNPRRLRGSDFLIRDGRKESGAKNELCKQ